ncbi:hypothetical protein [uncultured Alistipes sp.]|uniref:hypothetical protein n=1 Tax=uncultured Alistipes sp. TaxID=538949 RepID=UPI00260C25CC|nr:hypothetical protein [uncultured Alistipes sp.]
MKPWIANLSFIFIELLLIAIAFIMAFGAIQCLIDGDFAGYFSEMDDMLGYISALSGIIVIMSVLYLAIKPLRTKFTRFWSICNIIWIGINMALMYMHS